MKPRSTLVQLQEFHTLTQNLTFDPRDANSSVLAVAGLPELTRTKLLLLFLSRDSKRTALNKNLSPFVVSFAVGFLPGLHVYKIS